MPAVIYPSLYIFAFLEQQCLMHYVLCVLQLFLHASFDAATVTGNMTWSFCSAMTTTGWCYCWLLILYFSAGWMDFWLSWQDKI